MADFTYRYDLRGVFEDFLTMAICASSQIPGEGKSYYEDLYLEAIAKYKSDELRHNFPKMFACLTLEMENRLGSGAGNDVLGEYYEQNFSRKNSGQFFTPWPICEFMAHSICGEAKAEDKPQRVIDPTCGSGRTLLASAKVLGPTHEYYGVDIDHTCVKMAVLNLFFNGVFHAEVMCADALMPGSFITSYHTSFLPFRIFKTEDRERSRLWYMYQNTFHVTKPEKQRPDFIADRIPPAGPQLKLF